MSETQLTANIRLALEGRPYVRIFRNNVGRLQDIRGAYVSYGLGPGTSDLIGYRSSVVTADMVGRRVAIFTAVEVKHGRTAPERLRMQRAFLDTVRGHGGLAGFAWSVEDALAILDGTPI